MALDERLAVIVAAQSELRAMQEQYREGLKSSGDGGNSGGMSEDWKASVDRQLGILHADVRHLLYGLIGGFLILLGAGATAYIKLSDQITESRVSQASANAKLDQVLQQLGQNGANPSK